MISRIAGWAAATIAVLLILGLALLVLGPAVAACALPPRSAEPEAVVGSGEVIAEDRTGGAFQHVSVGAGISVTVASGSPASVRLSAQANLLPLIRSEVTGGQLIVLVESPGISTREPITLEIVAPDIRSVTLSAGATGTLDLTVEELAVDVSAGSRLTATGGATTLRVTASGGARAMLGDFTAGAAIVELTGGAAAELNVVGEVTGSAVAGAVLTLVSTPTKVDVQTSGGGLVLGG